MGYLRIFVFGIAILLAMRVESFACDICAVYVATEAQGLSRKGLYAGVAEQFTRFGALRSDGSEVPNPTGQGLSSSITQVMAGFSFIPRFGVQATIPLIRHSFKRPEGFQIDRGAESGLGDVSLLGKLLLWRKDTDRVTFTWSALGGVKFPTGRSDRIKEELSESDVAGAPESGIHGHDLTLGSGSFDGIVGANLYLRYGRAFLTQAMQYALRTKGDFDYRFANDLTWNSNPGLYLVLNHAYTVALQVAISGDHKGTDTFQGASAEDTGMMAAYIGPGLLVTHGEGLSAEIGVDIPASIQNTALQAVSDFRVRAGMRWNF